jgi:hypothetical protein
LNIGIAVHSSTGAEAGAQMLPGIILPKLFHDYRNDMRTKAAAMARMVK